MFELICKQPDYTLNKISQSITGRSFIGTTLSLFRQKSDGVHCRLHKDDLLSTVSDINRITFFLNPNRSVMSSFKVDINIVIQSYVSSSKIDVVWNVSTDIYLYIY